VGMERIERKGMERRKSKTEKEDHEEVRK